MTTDDVANWIFTYVLIGALIWALVYRPPADGRFRRAAFTASVGIILLWPAAIIGIGTSLYRAWRR